MCCFRCLFIYNGQDNNRWCSFGVCFFEVPVDAYEKSLKNVKVVIDAGHGGCRSVSYTHLDVYKRQTLQ